MEWYTNNFKMHWTTKINNTKCDVKAYFRNNQTDTDWLLLCLVHIMTSQSAHNELSASPRNPNVSTEIRSIY